MKNLILILSVLFLFSCKKEDNGLVGTYNRVGILCKGQLVSDTIYESFTFNSNGTFVSTKGNGTFTNNSIKLNGNDFTLRIESRMIYIDTVAYFN